MKIHNFFQAFSGGRNTRGLYNKHIPA